MTIQLLQSKSKRAEWLVEFDDGSIARVSTLNGKTTGGVVHDRRNFKVWDITKREAELVNNKLRQITVRS